MKEKDNILQIVTGNLKGIDNNDVFYEQINHEEAGEEFSRAQQMVHHNRQ